LKLLIKQKTNNEVLIENRALVRILFKKRMTYRLPQHY